MMKITLILINISTLLASSMPSYRLISNNSNIEYNVEKCLNTPSYNSNYTYYSWNHMISPPITVTNTTCCVTSIDTTKVCKCQSGETIPSTDSQTYLCDNGVKFQKYNMYDCYYVGDRCGKSTEDSSAISVNIINIKVIIILIGLMFMI